MKSIISRETEEHHTHDPTGGCCAAFPVGDELKKGVSRRDFVRAAGAFTLSIAVPTWLTACGGGGSSASGARGEPVKFTHGTGLCNLPLFISKERKLTEKDDVFLEFLPTPQVADISTAFASGKVEMSVIPYSNLLAIADQGAPVRVVSGSGIEGCIIIGSEGVDSVEKIRGKRVATFQADTLDVIMYDYLKENGLTYEDVEMTYLGDSAELANALVNGNVDVISHIEPYATQVVRKAGGNVLSDGRGLYGAGYPDCVLAASETMIQENPDVVKAVIRGMFEAEVFIENDFQAAAEQTVGKYYQTDLEDLVSAAKSQPPGVDIRDKQQFILDRSETMQALNYIEQAAAPELFDFSLLEEVIGENSDLYDKVRVKSEGA